MTNTNTPDSVSQCDCCPATVEFDRVYDSPNSPFYALVARSGGSDHLSTWCGEHEPARRIIRGSGIYYSHNSGGWVSNNRAPVCQDHATLMPCMHCPEVHHLAQDMTVGEWAI
jgi:hypothetical protein